MTDIVHPSAERAEAERHGIDIETVAAQILRAHRARTGAPAPAPHDLDVRVWIPAGARKSRRRLFVRLDVAGTPTAVAKVPLSAHDRKLAYEFEVLSALHPSFPLARPVPLDRLGGGFTMSYLGGSDLPAVPGLTAGPDACWRVLRPVVDSVATLHLAPLDDNAPALTPYQAAAQYVRRPEFGAAHADRALRAALLARTHGDLGPWNVRYDVDDGTVLLLDFEDYRPVGVAGIDVVNLLLTCGLLIFPDYPKRGFDWLYDQVFESDHWFRAVLTRALTHYSTATGQRPGSVADLTPLMCQWLIERITAEGRDTSGMFYCTFADRYLSTRPSLARSLDA